MQTKEVWNEPEVYLSPKSEVREFFGGLVFFAVIALALAVYMIAYAPSI